jgi:hypothetical protein
MKYSPMNNEITNSNLDEDDNLSVTNKIFYSNKINSNI